MHHVCKNVRKREKTKKWTTSRRAQKRWSFVPKVLWGKNETQLLELGTDHKNLAQLVENYFNMADFDLFYINHDSTPIGENGNRNDYLSSEVFRPSQK